MCFFVFINIGEVDRLKWYVYLNIRRFCKNTIKTYKYVVDNMYYGSFRREKYGMNIVGFIKEYI